MIRLVSAKFTCPPLYGFRNVTDAAVDKPEPYLRGWRLSIRGASVFLISPPGWSNAHASTPSEWKGSASAIYEIPRSQCHFQWSGDAAEIGKLQTYDSEPFDTPENRKAKAASETDKTTGVQVKR